MRTLCSAIVLISCLCAGLLRADTFKLSNGQVITGELLPTSANDQGVQVKVGEGQYERVPWANFSQEDLKTFAKNTRMQPFVEPFIEISPEEKIKKTEVPIKQPPRLERPPRRSLLGAMFSSSLGLFVLLILYAANIFAAYEIAIFRAQQIPLVCGVSAVLPFFGPIIFLSIPMKVAPKQETWDTGVEGEQAPHPTGAPTSATAASPEAAEEEVNPMKGDISARPPGLKLAVSSHDAAKEAPAAATVFQRGQFTFNRRFFETKFPGFFSVVKREADRDMVLLIKSARGEYAGTRITRIGSNDLHLEVQKGNASEEVMIPFQEIKEIQLKHK